MLARIDDDMRDIAFDLALRIAEAIHDMASVYHGHVDVLLDTEPSSTCLLAEVPDRFARAVSALLAAGPFVFRFADYQGRSYPGIVTHGSHALQSIGNAPCAILLGDRMAEWVRSNRWALPISRCVEAGHPIGLSPSHPASVDIFHLALSETRTRGERHQSHPETALRHLSSLVDFIEREGQCDDISLIGRPLGDGRTYLLDRHVLDTRTLCVHVETDEGSESIGSIRPLTGPIPPYLIPSQTLSDRPLFDRAIWVKSIFDWMHSTVMPEHETAHGFLGY